MTTRSTQSAARKVLDSGLIWFGDFSVCNHPDVLTVVADGNAGLDLQAQGPYDGYRALHNAVGPSKGRAHFTSTGRP